MIGSVVDAGDAQPHQPVLVEFPVLVAVAAEPVAAVVVPFIGEAHGDAVVAERPDFLDQAVVELAAPFARQECFDRLAALEELRAVAPAAVGRVGERDARRDRGVFQASSAMRAFCAAVSAVKGGSWRTAHGCVLLGSSGSCRGRSQRPAAGCGTEVQAALRAATTGKSMSVLATSLM